VSLDQEVIAEELKYERSKTQAPDYKIPQTPGLDLIFREYTFSPRLNISDRDSFLNDYKC